MDRTDDPTTAPDTASASITETVAAAGAEVFGRHQVNAAGLDPAGTVTGSDAGQAGAAQGLPAQGSPLVPDPLVKKSVSVVVRAIDSHIQRKLYGGALRVTDDAHFAAAFVTETALTDHEADTMGELSAVICAKHGITAKYAPEFALVCCVGSYGGRIYFALRKLEQMHAEKQALLKAKAKAEAN